MMTRFVKSFFDSLSQPPPLLIDEERKKRPFYFKRLPITVQEHLLEHICVNKTGTERYHNSGIESDSFDVRLSHDSERIGYVDMVRNESSKSLRWGTFYPHSNFRGAKRRGVGTFVHMKILDYYANTLQSPEKYQISHSSAITTSRFFHLRSLGVHDNSLVSFWIIGGNFSATPFMEYYERCFQAASKKSVFSDSYTTRT